MVEKMAKDRTEEIAELINAGEVNVEELIDVAPIIKNE